jgi:negative regulator of sigma E activity
MTNKLVNLIYTLLLLLSATQLSAAAAQESSSGGPLEQLKEKYQGLNPKGKFVSAACVGFVGSRLVLSFAVRAVKVGAAAFIA